MDQKLSRTPLIDKIQINQSGHYTRRAALWAIMAFEGLIALAGLLHTPSEAGAALIIGFSPLRILVAGITIFAITTLGICTVAAFFQPGWWKRIDRQFERLFASSTRLFVVFAGMVALFLSILALLILSVTPASREIVLLKTLIDRTGLLLGWLELMLLQLGLMIIYDARSNGRPLAFSDPLRLGVLLTIASVIYVITLKVFLKSTWDLRFRRLDDYIFLPAFVLLAWGILHYFAKTKSWYLFANKILMVIFLGMATFIIYWHTAQWINRTSTSNSATWHLVSQSFLEGRLYLDNPGDTHDLTLYKGHWYVPLPPLPALVLLPFVAIIGVAKINMVQFAILCGAINAILVYLILAKASDLKIIPTTQAGNLWLTAMFILGTAHWWLSVTGIYWYLSQLLTVMFAGFALWMVLRRASPWLVGFFLGGAILSRPNVLMLWPLLAGVALYLAKEREGQINWKNFIFWAVRTAVPVSLSIAGLLFYNYLRFENFFDFGYVTVNSSEWIMEPVRTYGMFNVHFLPINLYTMFLRMPFVGFVKGSFYYSPGYEGTSVLAMTPAIIYTFRRFKSNWASIGALISLVLSVGMLMLYSNTGSWQLGYRYVTDFIFPVLMLAAVGIGKPTSKIFIALVILSIVINGAGIAWWYTHM